MLEIRILRLTCYSPRPLLDFTVAGGGSTRDRGGTEVSSVVPAISLESAPTVIGPSRVQPGPMCTLRSSVGPPIFPEARSNASPSVTLDRKSTRLKSSHVKI